MVRRLCATYREVLWERRQTGLFFGATLYLPDTAAKVKFLQSPQAYGGASQRVECIETHMSWVFLTDGQVYKLKKPVRTSLLDFGTEQRRAFFCEEEVRLNSRLAPGVYLDVVALQWCKGAFTLVPKAQVPAPGETVDWLVRMKRLPRHRMLTTVMASHRLAPGDLVALVDVLGAFYAKAPAAAVDSADYVSHFKSEQALNRSVLLHPQFQLPDAALALDRYDTLLNQSKDLLAQRVHSHHVVEGHGDLRPDHVCLLRQPVVIDCLEFSPRLRQVDPFDELVHLGLECAMAGVPWVGPYLVSGIAAALGERPQLDLLQFYTAHRALLRARLAMGHLLDPQPRLAQKWPPLAQRYIRRALAAADAFTSTTRGGWLR